MSNDIAKAVEILKQGGLVAFPTETVYGLGADATNPAAVAKIFEVKGRPPTNPLIVHVADLAMAKQCVTEWPSFAQRLVEQFWPGPLTLVLAKSPRIIDAVTAGKNTVGVRMPNHAVALDLLKEFAGPLAAPSANLSTRVSPTAAHHVRLGLSQVMVLEGGPASVGIESTILDLTRTPPTILRPGAITREQIEQVIGPVQLLTGHADPHIAASSPGQQEVHYSPYARALRYEKSQLAEVEKWADRHAVEGVGCIDSTNMPNNAAEYARLLYSMMREVDQWNPDFMVIEMPPDTPEWLAIRDRIIRATQPFSPDIS